MSEGLLDELLADADAAGPYPQGSFAGSGIVTCAGGPIMLANVYVLVRVLRSIHQTRLPIEIWHMGQAEMPAFLAEMFVDLGCTVIDAKSIATPMDSRYVDGWQLKAFALKHSSFENVILLDADQVPLQDPAVVLDWPEYKDTGAVFWPDILDIAEDNPIWAMLDLHPEQVRSWESGQLCISKAIHWRAINLVLAFNARAENVYKYVYGDKDTFLFAWRIVNGRFSLVPHPPLQGERFLLQRDFSGDPLFQHHTNCKWSLTKPNQSLEGMQLFDECKGFLDELRKVWNGVIFHAPMRSVEAQVVEKELIRQCAFTAVRETEQAFNVELLRGHQIGDGRSRDLANWYVDQQRDGFVLVLMDRYKARMRLSRDKTGRWLKHSAGDHEDILWLEPLHSEEGSDDGAEPPIELVADLIRVAHNRLPELDCALELLVETNADVLRQIEIAAVFYEERDTPLARHLKDLATRLKHVAEASDRSVRQMIIDEPELYIRN